MQISTYGNIVFYADLSRVKTLSEFMHKGSARWAVHEIIGNVCKPDFLGPGQSEITFKMLLLAELGESPRSSASALWGMMNAGTVAPFIIGGQPVGSGHWYIEALEEGEYIVNSRGETRRLVMSATLKEYF